MAMQKYKTSPWLLPHMVPFFYIALLLGLYLIHIITFPIKGFLWNFLAISSTYMYSHQGAFWNKFLEQSFLEVCYKFAQRRPISHQCISTSMPTCSHATTISVIVARCGGRRRVFFFPSCVWCGE